MNEIIKQQKPEFVSFLNSIDDKILKAKLELKTIELDSLWGNAYTETGRILKELQDEFANNKNGHFLKYLEVIGLKERTAYNLIYRYDFISQNLRDINIESLPLSLSYEISKPSAPAQLVAQVLEGDITSHKQYKEMEAKIKEQERLLAGAKRAENSLQLALQSYNRDLDEKDDFIASKEALIKTLLDKIDEGTETIKYVDDPEHISKLKDLENINKDNQSKLIKFAQEIDKKESEIKNFQDLKNKEKEIKEIYNDIEKLRNEKESITNQLDETTQILDVFSGIKKAINNKFIPLTLLNIPNQSKMINHEINHEINHIFNNLYNWISSVKAKFNIQ